MKKAALISIVVVVIQLAVGVMAQAQQPKKVPRKGYLGGSATANPDRLESFRRGLRDLGYVEGKNIALELRFPEGDLQRERAFAIAFGLYRITSPPKALQPFVPIVKAGEVVSLRAVIY